MSIVEVSGKSERLNKFKKDVEWFNSNYEALKQEHVGEYVAIKNGKVVAFHKDINELMQKLKKKHIESAFTLKEFIKDDNIISR